MPKPKTSIIFLAITISASLLILSAILYFLYYLWYSLVHKPRTSPFDAASPINKLQTFSYKELKSATNSFCASNSIGKGGSGTVFRGILTDGKLVAVKLLDSNYSQSEQEFHNELKTLGGLKPCPLIVSLIGFCVEKDNRLVVFEYMPNRSLQESLFFDNSDNNNNNNDFNLCLNWGIRFNIILDVAKALSFLHLECEPAVIHGDVKPSNVLLDSEFRAKLSDFGLSKFKLGEAEVGVDLFSQELSGTLNVNENETPPIGTPLESLENKEVDFTLALQASSSSKNSSRIHHSSVGLAMNFNISSQGGNSKLKGINGEFQFMPYDDVLSSVDHSKELSLNVIDDISSLNAVTKQWGKDWWLKQDGIGELCSKDYVAEWIGSQISPDSEIPHWDEERGTKQEKISLDNSKILEKRKVNIAQESGFELHGGVVKKIRSKKRQKMHEWWKEENLVEISNKAKRVRAWKKNAPHFGLGKCFGFRRIKGKSRQDYENGGDQNQSTEFSFRLGWRKKQKQHFRSMGSEMWSGDPFSPELSSTTSMKGTLCYVVPEYNGYGDLMEKADIYSLGVLILVIVSGRRPLHVLASPMKLEKANLISWAKSLAYSGNILDLVDERLKDEYNKEQASLCIVLALACLQKMPELRPDIGDIIKVLKGEMELPQLPFELSPSPPPKIFSRSGRK